MRQTAFEPTAHTAGDTVLPLKVATMTTMRVGTGMAAITGLGSATMSRITGSMMETGTTSQASEEREIYPGEEAKPDDS